MRTAARSLALRLRELRATSSWLAVMGFFVNGPEAYTGTGQPTGTPGERRITLPAEKPGTYQVHVFNYIDGLPIAYRVSTGPVAES